MSLYLSNQRSRRQLNDFLSRFNQLILPRLVNSKFCYHRNMRFFAGFYSALFYNVKWQLLMAFVLRSVTSLPLAHPRPNKKSLYGKSSNSEWLFLSFWQWWASTTWSLRRTSTHSFGPSVIFDTLHTLILILIQLAASQLQPTLYRSSNYYNIFPFTRAPIPPLYPTKEPLKSWKNLQARPLKKYL